MSSKKYRLSLESFGSNTAAPTFSKIVSKTSSILIQNNFKYSHNEISEILKRCSVSYCVQNEKNFGVKGISFNSKRIKENFIFAAVKGSEDNGEKYLKDLKKLNNIGIIVREGFRVKKDYNNLLIIRTRDVRELAGEIASIIYPNSIEEKIAITGTNGKTSISHYVSELSSKQKISNCIFGTLGIIFNNKRIFNTDLTTNESIINHKYMNELSKKNCKRVIFEASSIGLDQKRLQNIKFDKIAITNLTIDHLDYQKHLKNIDILNLYFLENIVIKIRLLSLMLILQDLIISKNRQKNYSFRLR